MSRYPHTIPVAVIYKLKAFFSFPPFFGDFFAFPTKKILSLTDSGQYFEHWGKKFGNLCEIRRLAVLPYSFPNTTKYSFTKDTR